MPPQDYAAEARQIVRLARRAARRPLRQLLHLGCGAGSLDFNLKNRFAITGIDLNQEMLALARQQNPQARYLQGDMRSLRLAEKFDLVITGDSIEYMLDEHDLGLAFQTAAAHLQPGGVLVTCAEVAVETFVQNASSWATVSHQGSEIAFFENRFDPDPADTSYDATYVFLIRQDGALRVESDSHKLGLFPLPTWQIQLQQAGFHVKIDQDRQRRVWFTGVI